MIKFTNRVQTIRPVLIVCLLVLFFLSACTQKQEKKKPNVLFIIVDDLRPELGCYGNKEIKTPNFDRLAASGTLFTRAFCQVAVCAPSRASVMTGLRPDSSRVWVLGDSFRKNLPEVVTIPQHFKKSGYHTVSIGKIFHNHMPDSVSFDEPDLRPAAYSTPDMVDRDAESFYYDEKIKKEHALVRVQRIKDKWLALWLPESYTMSIPILLKMKTWRTTTAGNLL